MIIVGINFKTHKSSLNFNKMVQKKFGKDIELRFSGISVISGRQVIKNIRYFYYDKVYLFSREPIDNDRIKEIQSFILTTYNEISKGLYYRQYFRLKRIQLIIVVKK